MAYREWNLFGLSEGRLNGQIDRLERCECSEGPKSAEIDRKMQVVRRPQGAFIKSVLMRLTMQVWLSVFAVFDLRMHIECSDGSKSMLTARNLPTCYAESKRSYATMACMLLFLAVWLAANINSHVCRGAKQMSYRACQMDHLHLNHVY
jgi:hypothetical protein